MSNEIKGYDVGKKVKGRKTFGSPTPWSWLTNHRRLQIDYERDPVFHAGFMWAAHTGLLLRRITQASPT